MRGDCPLRYHLLITKGQEMGAVGAKLPMPTPNLMSEQSIVVSLEGTNLRMRSEDHRTAFVKGDVRGPLMQGPPSLGATVVNHGDHLEGTGSMWFDNPQGAQLALLWPALPAETRIGATRTWIIPDDDEPIEMGEVRIEARHRDAWVLSATWQEHLGETQPLPAHPRMQGMSVTQQGHLEGRATWEVTDDGRLLRAEVVRDLDMLMTFGETRPQHHRMLTRHQATLVESCDGLAATPPEVANSPASRAVDVWSAVVEAAQDGRSTLGYFAPALVNRHGAKLDETLHRYVEVHGVRALGPPTIAPEIARVGSQMIIPLIASRDTGPRSSVQLHAEVALDASVDPPRVTRVSIADPSTTPQLVLLQLDSTQLVFNR